MRVHRESMREINAQIAETERQIREQNREHREFMRKMKDDEKKRKEEYKRQEAIKKNILIKDQELYEERILSRKNMRIEMIRKVLH
jgi:hypothetical protein